MKELRTKAIKTGLQKAYPTINELDDQTHVNKSYTTINKTDATLSRRHLIEAGVSQRAVLCVFAFHVGTGIVGRVADLSQWI